MIKDIAAFIAITSFVLAITLWIAPRGLPTCEYEDEANCIWDAQTQGNGGGQSFIAIEDLRIPY